MAERNDKGKENSVVEEVGKIAPPHHAFTSVNGLEQKFLELCHEQVKKANYKGTSLKPHSWNEVIAALKSEFGYDFELKALRNKWGELRKIYKAWRDCANTSGHGVNFETGEIDWPKEKWDEAIQRNPDIAKLKRSGPLRSYKELCNLFETVLTTGDNIWPSGANNQLPVHDVDGRGEKNNDAFWQDVTFDVDSPISIPSPAPTPTPTSSNSTKRKRVITQKDVPESEVVDLVDIFKEYVMNLKNADDAKEARRAEKEARRMAEMAEKEARRAEKMAEKARYSLIACMRILSTLNLDQEVYKKAIVKLADNEEYRKVLVDLENANEKLLFVLGITSY